MTEWREEGSATVLVVAAAGAVVAVLAGVLLVTSAVRDAHRARAAADLAALAAAGGMAVGGVADCGVGASVARANGATMTSCTVEAEGSVVVSVVVRLSGRSGLGYLPPTVSARARAGVVQPPSPLPHGGGQPAWSP